MNCGADFNHDEYWVGRRYETEIRGRSESASKDKHARSKVWRLSAVKPLQHWGHINEACFAAGSLHSAAEGRGRWAVGVQIVAFSTSLYPATWCQISTQRRQRVCDLDARRRLCSSSTSVIVASRTMRAIIGDRAFPAAAASVWNSLSESVRASTSPTVFKVFCVVTPSTRVCQPTLLYRRYQLSDVS